MNRSLWLLMLAVACQQQTQQNLPPVATPGAEQTVLAGDTVTLDASGSSDPENDVLSFSWTQTTGPMVTLDSVSQTTVRFIAPSVTTATTLVFKLDVSDGTNLSSATTSVTIMPAGSNRPPVPSALAPTQVQAGSR